MGQMQGGRKAPAGRIQGNHTNWESKNGKGNRGGEKRKKRKRGGGKKKRKTTEKRKEKGEE